MLFRSPEPPGLPLLGVLDQALGGLVVGQSLLDAIHQRTLWPADRCEFNLPTECVGHQVSFTRLILHDKIKFRKKVLPPSLLGGKLFLCLEVARGHVVGLDHEFRPQ